MPKDDTRTNLLRLREAMTKKGWDQLNIDRSEPCFKSVCFVAVDALLNVELASLSRKAVSDLSLFLAYLHDNFVCQDADCDPTISNDVGDLKAYLCGTGLFICSSVMLTGAKYNGEGEMPSYHEVSPDDRSRENAVLGEWWDDAAYFWQLPYDVGRSKIYRSLKGGAVSRAREKPARRPAL